MAGVEADDMMNREEISAMLGKRKVGRVYFLSSKIG
jgi:hypothetical protein